MKSKKELIFESFQKMDCNMLSILLDNGKTYHGATKDVFLEKLNIAFSNLKASGDTILHLYKGFCNSDSCSNKGCNGYSFLGNKSKKHLDLIFNETNNEIIDIFHCYNFKTIDQSIDKGLLINIEIMKDEKANFKPNIDFLIKRQNCKLAYEELIHYQNTIIDKEIYLVWLDKFNLLFNSFDFTAYYYSEISTFYSLYNAINELKDFLQENNSARIALNEFETLNQHDETQLLKWLTKHEKTANNLTLFLYEEIEFEQPYDKDYFEVNGLKICTLDFKHISNFKDIFDAHYWNMLKKYNIFSEDEQREHLKENTEISNLLFSLSYHLEKRGIKI